MKIVATLAVVASLFFTAGSALAAGTTCSAYNAQTCSSIGPVSQSNNGNGSGSGGGAGTTVRTTSASLPFTGLDAGLIAGGGLILLAVGLGVRRVVAHPRQL